MCWKDHQLQKQHMYAICQIHRVTASEILTVFFLSKTLYVSSGKGFRIYDHNPEVYLLFPLFVCFSLDEYVNVCGGRLLTTNLKIRYYNQSYTLVLCVHFISETLPEKYGLKFENTLS